MSLAPSEDAIEGLETVDEIGLGVSKREALEVDDCEHLVRALAVLHALVV